MWLSSTRRVAGGTEELTFDISMTLNLNSHPRLVTTVSDNVVWF